MVTNKRTAKEIMTTQVHTVRPTDPLEKVVALICRHSISGVPVVDGKGRLVGLISEQEIIRAMDPGNGPSLPGTKPGRRAPGGLRDVRGLKAKDVMVTGVTTTRSDTDFLRLASIMALQKIRRVPIVDGETLVGIVSHSDVGRAIFGMPGRSAVCPAIRSDGDQPSRTGPEHLPDSMGKERKR